MDTIPDPARHREAFKAFVTITGNMARSLFEEANSDSQTYINGSMFGRTLREMDLSTMSLVTHEKLEDVYACAFAYHLRMHSTHIEEQVTALVSLHYPRVEMFDMVLAHEFNCTRYNLGKHYGPLKALFDEWVETFGPDVMEKKGSKR